MPIKSEVIPVHLCYDRNLVIVDVHYIAVVETGDFEYSVDLSGVDITMKLNKNQLSQIDTVIENRLKEALV